MKKNWIIGILAIILGVSIVFALVQRTAAKRNEELATMNMQEVKKLQRELEIANFGMLAAKNEAELMRQQMLKSNEELKKVKR